MQAKKPNNIPRDYYKGRTNPIMDLNSSLEDFKQAVEELSKYDDWKESIDQYNCLFFGENQPENSLEDIGCTWRGGSSALQYCDGIHRYNSVEKNELNFQKLLLLLKAGANPYIRVPGTLGGLPNFICYRPNILEMLALKGMDKYGHRLEKELHEMGYDDLHYGSKTKAYLNCLWATFKSHKVVCTTFAIGVLGTIATFTACITGAIPSRNVFDKALFASAAIIVLPMTTLFVCAIADLIGSVAYCKFGSKGKDGLPTWYSPS